jgi:hypothetical protein
VRLNRTPERCSAIVAARAVRVIHQIAQPAAFPAHFDFGKWHSLVASRINDDGTTSFITIDPAVDGFNFVGERDGKRALIIRDVQHEYAFIESALK